MDTIKKNDFIEIDYTGKADGKIFDTTKPGESKEISMEKLEARPFIISVGNDMVLKGFEEALEGKEVGKEYAIHLMPEKAFGKRNSSLVRTYSLTSFRKNNLNPVPGMTLQLDNALAKVLTVNGGRVTIDFNNPLAGKEIDYQFKITRKITDDKEKINALQDYFFRQRFEFEIKDKKIILKEKMVKVFLDILGEKFKTMTGLEWTVEEKAEDKKEKDIKDIKKTNPQEDTSKQPLGVLDKEKSKTDTPKK
ncbi:MAG: hypothetical protein RL557_770 [archaeon]|jgi:FKBP-type peptidyl-prolyl cis-trans isomerase 2